MRWNDDLFGGGEAASPSVLRPENTADPGAAEERPPTVYVPSERVSNPTPDAEVTIELRALEDGTLAMLCYTSLQELVDSCGDGQPWIAIRDYQLDGVRDASGAEVLLWDAGLPLEERKTKHQEGGA